MSSDIIVSPDIRSISSSKAWRGFEFRNIMSAEPSDDATLRFTRDSAPFPGGIYIGFISPEIFTPDTEVFREDGSYALCPAIGALYGSGKRSTPYCSGFGGAVVRMLVDRKAGTISYNINGVEHGAAWTNVAPGPLHVFVVLVQPGVRVELL